MYSSMMLKNYKFKPKPPTISADTEGRKRQNKEEGLFFLNRYWQSYRLNNDGTLPDPRLTEYTPDEKLPPPFNLELQTINRRVWCAGKTRRIKPSQKTPTDVYASTTCSSINCSVQQPWSAQTPLPFHNYPFISYPRIVLSPSVVPIDPRFICQNTSATMGRQQIPYISPYRPLPWKPMRRSPYMPFNALSKRKPPRTEIKQTAEGPVLVKTYENRRVYIYQDKCLKKAKKV